MKKSMVSVLMVLLLLTGCSLQNHTIKMLDFLPLEFSFESGFGSLETTVTLASDGSFSGAFSDVNMGEWGESYPNGTTLVCNFDGRFGKIKQINEYTYSLTLEEIHIEHDRGEEWIEDGMRYVAETPIGFEEGTTFLLYTPDAPVSELSEDYLSSWPDRVKEEQPTTISYYALCNTVAQQGLFALNG